MRMAEALKSVMMRKIGVQYLRQRIQGKVHQQSHCPGEHCYKAIKERVYLGSWMPVLQNPDKLRDCCNSKSITADFIFILLTFRKKTSA